MAATQSNSEAKIKTPLGADVLLLHGMSMTETLGQLFSIDLNLLSEKEDISFEAILGQNVTIELKLNGGGKRFFNGHVTHFSQTGSSGRYEVYQATVRPWFWFLTRTADCRIFQEMSVPDIVKKVFRDLGFTDFKDKLTKNYRTWEYCVQYRETDFNFVSRLLEQEGIYYYFTHDDGVHNLVLSDSLSAHQPLPGYATIDYYPPDDAAIRSKDHIFSWAISKQVQPGKYVLNEFDFIKPTADLITQYDEVKPHNKSDYEIYDYPGEYDKTDDGDKYAQARIEELHSGYELGKGESGARVMNTGALFSLAKFPRSDQNREYLVTSALHTIRSHEYGSGGENNSELYSNSFTAVDSKTPFRASRITPKPIVQGAQTAIVVGPAGEEIHTDKYGRVKIQFHWDRYGVKDENSSCWVRVAQVWAGNKWGGIHIPRIGQEVIVDFMEGDPDRPIITGRVYNANQMPPYDLPTNKTQSGIKSRSSKNGTSANFNEIRMEDKKGSEELYIHAERNEKIIVERNKTESVGVNETITIGNNRKETVGKDETLTVNNDRTRTVKGTEVVTVQRLRYHNVLINEMINVGGFQETQVAAFRTVNVGGYQMINVALYQDVSIGENYKLSVGASRTTDVTDDDSHTIGKSLSYEVGDDVSITNGASKITMNKSGKIEISGTDVTLKAGAGKVNINIAGIIDIKGPMVKINT